MGEGWWLRVWAWDGWREARVVGWAVRDAEGRYLTSLRRGEWISRQTIILREEPSRELRRYLGWLGYRVVRVVRTTWRERCHGYRCAPGVGQQCQALPWPHGLLPSVCSWAPWGLAG